LLFPNIEKKLVSDEKMGQFSRGNVEFIARASKPPRDVCGEKKGSPVK
jgi:hypothetical protein